MIYSKKYTCKTKNKHMTKRERTKKTKSEMEKSEKKKLRRKEELILTLFFFCLLKCNKTSLRK